MRSLAVSTVLLVLLTVAGCALPDWLVPRTGKPVVMSDSTRQTQQEAFDRQARRSSTGMKNGTRSALMGTSDYIPGSSSSPFAP
jgi:hypothetical protein